MTERFGVFVLAVVRGDGHGKVVLRGHIVIQLEGHQRKWTFASPDPRFEIGVQEVWRGKNKANTSPILSDVAK